MQVVAATKKELAEVGVNIVALESASRASGHAASSSEVSRSSTVLLVKNLPTEATEDALKELFSKHGIVLRVILPRTKALAIVEMSDKQVLLYFHSVHLYTFSSLQTLSRARMKAISETPNV
jgi:RNA recognition motif-containing protein